MHGYQSQSPAPICSFPILDTCASSEIPLSHASSQKYRQPTFHLFQLLKLLLYIFLSSTTAAVIHLPLKDGLEGQPKLDEPLLSRSGILIKYKSNWLKILHWLPITCMMKSKLPLHTGLQNTIIAVASVPTLCNAVTLPILSHIHSTRFTTMSLHNLFPLPEMIRLNSSISEQGFQSQFFRKFSLTSTFHSAHFFFIICLFGYSRLWGWREPGLSYLSWDHEWWTVNSSYSDVC